MSYVHLNFQCRSVERALWSFFKTKPTNDKVKSVLSKDGATDSSYLVVQLLMAHFIENQEGLILQQNVSFLYSLCLLVFERIPVLKFSCTHSYAVSDLCDLRLWSKRYCNGKLCVCPYKANAWGASSSKGYKGTIKVMHKTPVI